MKAEAQPVGLFDLTLDELSHLIESWGEPAYRARQIWQQLYGSLAASFDELRALPPSLRERLARETTLNRLTPITEQVSSDGQTRKALFALPDGAQIEAVLMGYERRQTACISTQAGCAMNCSFCATGQGGWQRHLTSGEIVEQVLYFARAPSPRSSYPQPITNVVFMGMGEPFANMEAFLAAARRLNDPAGFNLGARRMTVSTVGLVPGIHHLAEQDLQINLAVSLHAATDELRDRLAPINRRYPLRALLPAVRAYTERTRRRVSLEWALIENVNDTLEQARALAQWARGLLCHVNLIPLNPTRGYSGAGSTRDSIAAFRSVLELAGIPNTLRLRRGMDIQAGCGQLKSQMSKPKSARHSARG